MDIQAMGVKCQADRVKCQSEGKNSTTDSLASLETTI